MEPGKWADWMNAFGICLAGTGAVFAVAVDLRAYKAQRAMTERNSHTNLTKTPGGNCGSTRPKQARLQHKRVYVGAQRQPLEGKASTDNMRTLEYARLTDAPKTHPISGPGLESLASVESDLSTTSRSLRARATRA
jgi:hypothetical protein